MILEKAVARVACQQADDKTLTARSQSHRAHAEPFSKQVSISQLSGRQHLFGDNGLIVWSLLTPAVLSEVCSWHYVPPSARCSKPRPFAEKLCSHHH